MSKELKESLGIKFDETEESERKKTAKEEAGKKGSWPFSMFSK